MRIWHLLANSYSLGGLTDRVRLRVGVFKGVIGTRKVMLVTAATAADVSAVVDSSAFDTGVGLLLLLDE